MVNIGVSPQFSDPNQQTGRREHGRSGHHFEGSPAATSNCVEVVGEDHANAGLIKKHAYHMGGTNFGPNLHHYCGGTPPYLLWAFIT